MFDAMNNMNTLMMHMNGISLEMRMSKWQKKEEKQLKNEVVTRNTFLE
jgi:hypothetical protein